MHARFELLSAPRPGERHSENAGTAAALQAAGMHVVAMDHQSYGESEGALGPSYRSFFWSFDDLVRDFTQLVEQVRADERYAGLPVFIKGTSLGGGVCLAVAARRPELVDGFVLVAPLISLDRVKAHGWNKILLPIGGLISLLYPTLPAGSKSPNPDVTRYAEFESDPLTHKGAVRARVAIEVLRYMDDVKELIPKVRAPFLVLHSPDDNMTEFEGSKALHDGASTPAELKALDAVEGWHALLHDENAPKHRTRITQWLDALCQRLRKGKMAEET